MAVLPIAITGTPVLHRPAAHIGEVTEEIRSLAADMVETMHAAPGVGLAAPQVGVGLRIFVWHFDDGLQLSEGVVINPTLSLSGPWPHRFRGEPDEEGCLSIPGLRYPLARAESAHLRGTNLDGHQVDIRATGWLARIFQHEFDHLRGVLYRDRLRRRWRRLADQDISQSEWLHDRHSWVPGVDGVESDFDVEPDSESESG